MLHLHRIQTNVSTILSLLQSIYTYHITYLDLNICNLQQCSFNYKFAKMSPINPSFTVLTRKEFTKYLNVLTAH